MPPRAEDFRKALKLKLEREAQAGQLYAEVRAGDLHRQVGDYPGDHRLAICCHVMRRELHEGDVILRTTPSGIGANLIIRYRLPRGPIMNDSDFVFADAAKVELRTLSPTKPITIPNMNIAENIKKFMEARTPEDRYASFDYCFNYFQDFHERDVLNEIASPENIQQSCLQLAFFLASWGMLRGSTFLLQKNAKHLEKLIIAISRLDKKYWRIDVDNYNDESIKLLLALKEVITNNLGGIGEKSSTTLITKIMLGVFGCVPALDRNFRKAFRVNNLNEKTLMKIAEYYKKNRTDFKKFEESIRTIDFVTGKETSRRYTKAKLIDMVGFVEGDKMQK